jgi:hypothetical protein
MPSGRGSAGPRHWVTGSWGCGARRAQAELLSRPVMPRAGEGRAERLDWVNGLQGCGEGGGRSLNIGMVAARRGPRDSP